MTIETWLSLVGTLVVSLSTSAGTVLLLRHRQRESDASARKHIAEAKKLNADADATMVNSAFALNDRLEERLAEAEAALAKANKDLDAAWSEIRRKAQELNRVETELAEVLRIGAKLVFVMIDVGIDPDRVLSVLPDRYRSAVLAEAEQMGRPGPPG